MENFEDVFSKKPENLFLDKLDNLGYVNPEKTLHTADGAIWLELVDKAGNTLEGKLFLAPPNSEKTITIFIPGMPGDITSKVEELWKDGLLEIGDLFVARHNGLNTKAGDAKLAVHCPEKSSDKWEFTGEQERKYSPIDFSKEPVVALDTIGRLYDKIKIASHSFGSFQVAHTLGTNKLPAEIISKIDKWVSLAGWTSETPASGVKFDYHSVFNDWLDEVKKTKAMNVVDDNKQFMKELEDLFGEIKKIPEGIKIISVNPARDEAVKIETGKDLQNIAEHALLVQDETEGLEDPGVDVHSFGHLKVLPRLLTMNVRGKHAVITRKK